MADRWVFCTYCRQTYLAGGGDRCDLCGKAGGLLDPSSLEAQQHEARRRQEEADLAASAVPAGESTATALGAWGVAKLSVLGFIFVVCGFWLMLAPLLRADPEASVSWKGIALASAVVAAGLFMLSVAARTLWGWIKET
jgi:hypothetical protein